MLKKINLVIKRITFLFILIFLLVFIFTNTEFVRINMAPFGYEIKIRTFLLIIISFLIGSVFGYFYDIFNIAKIKERVANKKKLRYMENELKKMKSNEK